MIRILQFIVIIFTNLLSKALQGFASWLMPEWSKMLKIEIIVPETELVDNLGGILNHRVKKRDQEIVDKIYETLDSIDLFHDENDFDYHYKYADFFDAYMVCYYFRFVDCYENKVDFELYISGGDRFPPSFKFIFNRFRESNKSKVIHIGDKRFSYFDKNDYDYDAIIEETLNYICDYHESLKPISAKSARKV